ncbi:Hypothetical predicted protein [Octopus vulgaris]|uniref:Uncharacterized protein n=1 Tax=Octopus vulgaris TaxID=6645 RepID=A0AA36BAR6_OCTVU|nr:Hypothetical predicted protein [Octopus vulgaris]
MSEKSIKECSSSTDNDSYDSSGVGNGNSDDDNDDGVCGDDDVEVSLVTELVLFWFLAVIPGNAASGLMFPRKLSILRTCEDISMPYF